MSVVRAAVIVVVDDAQILRSYQRYDRRICVAGHSRERARSGAADTSRGS